MNLTPETYEKLSQMAARKGCSPDALLRHLILKDELAQSLEDWKNEFREMRETVQSQLPVGITDEEIDADIEAAREEVWEERSRARSR